MVLTPLESEEMMIKLSSLCRKHHMPDISHATLVSIMGYEPNISPTRQKNNDNNSNDSNNNAISSGKKFI